MLSWKYLLFFLPITQIFAKSINEYLTERNTLIEKENESFLGADLELSVLETATNAIIMREKHAELDKAFEDPSSYSPANSFLKSRNNIANSSVYHLIRQLPKGGALHTHELSLASASWLVANITYKEHLYVSGYPDAPLFKWRNVKPSTDEDGKEWVLISELRSSEGAEVIDKWLVKYLDITVKDPSTTYSDIDKVWTAFLGVMIVTQNLLSYAPIYDEYIYQGLKEFHEDGVSYLEIRTVFPDTICADLSCSKVLNTLEVAKLNKDTIDRFTNDHPEFCGASMIYAPVRGVTPSKVEDEYLTNLKELRAEYPDLVRGFDLVGQEDKGKPLVDFIETLLKMKEIDPELKFVFHAGETNWFGSSTDENLFDAILLGTSRIGHGYALMKHPKLKSLVKSKTIAVEICPISNQVLGLVKDLRNHPGSPLFAEGDIPIVISSDDPGSWGAQGVGYDLYEAFMGLASRHMDFRLLKKLIWNSLEYSLLKQEEKDQCRRKFENKWLQSLNKLELE